VDIAGPERPERRLAFDEALDRLSAANPRAAELVKVGYFTSFSNAEAAALLANSPGKADQVWAYARAWLCEEIQAGWMRGPRRAAGSWSEMGANGVPRGLRRIGAYPGQGVRVKLVRSCSLTDRPRWDTPE
jgi:hypothetical protein